MTARDGTAFVRSETVEHRSALPGDRLPAKVLTPAQRELVRWLTQETLKSWRA
jgi:hypothetical protein